MAKVTRIIDAQFKTGRSAKGPWTLIKIDAEGTEATGFGPISIGDEVDLEQNAQYHNWNFKKIGMQEIPTTSDATQDMSSMLNQIYKQNEEILALLKVDSLTAKVVEAEVEKEVDDIGDGPINLDEIPF